MYTKVEVERKRFDELSSLLFSFLVDQYKGSTAKTNGITLYEHTQHVWEELEIIFSIRGKSIDRHSSKFAVAQQKLETDLFRTVFLHDLGKKHPRWQKFINGGAANYKTLNYRHETMGLYILLDVLNTDYESKEQLYEKMLECSHILFPILAHHNNMSHDRIQKFDPQYPEQYPPFIKLSCNLKRLFRGNDEISNLLMNFDSYIKETLSRKDVIDLWYRNSLTRHYLTFADRRASAKENGNLVISLEEVKASFYKFNPKWKKRPLQQMAIACTEPITILRAPTGQGKTTAALLWINERIKEGFERGIIAMPTQFTSNALSDALRDDSGVSHTVYTQHSATKFNYARKEEFFFSKTFESVINVCTIDQILYSFTLSKEEHHTRLFNIVNSCVVIDESDFYDNFIMANIIEMLKILQYFQVPVLFMSATLPDSFVDLLNKELKINITIQDDTSDLTRDRSFINDLVLTEAGWFDKIDELKEHKTAIVYTNTKERAKLVYNNLVSTGVSKDRVVIYHSELVNKDKVKLENRIITMLGRPAHEKGKADGIVIMTQIGELSINISSDYMLTDICPFDRLVQRLGRGSRFDKSICTVDVVVPVKDGKMYPAPYGEYIMSLGWQANQYFTNTVKVISECYAKGDVRFNGYKYLTIINSIYDKMKIDRRSQRNADLLFEYFRNNVIFNSDLKVDEDRNISDTIWKSRDILAQVKLYVGKPSDEYKELLDLEYDLFHNSLNISLYNFRKLDDLGMVQRITPRVRKGNFEYDEVFWIEEVHYSEQGINYPYN